MSERRVQRRYDHRLQDLVRETGDLSIATEVGVPRSTASGWLRAEPQDVISLDVLDMRELQLQAELVKQRRRVRLLGGVVGLLMAVLRVYGFRLDGSRLDGKRLPDGRDQKVLLRAVERARAVLVASRRAASTQDLGVSLSRLQPPEQVPARRAHELPQERAEPAHPGRGVHDP